MRYLTPLSFITFAFCIYYPVFANDTAPAKKPILCESNIKDWPSAEQSRFKSHTYEIEKSPFFQFLKNKLGNPVNCTIVYDNGKRGMENTDSYKYTYRFANGGFLYQENTSISDLEILGMPNLTWDDAVLLLKQSSGDSLWNKLKEYSILQDDVAYLKLGATSEKRFIKVPGFEDLSYGSSVLYKNGTIIGVMTEGSD